MKTAGIIAEYNPFHKGHLYQINKIKEKYQFNNLALAAKLDVWLIKYKQLGYDGIFDFSKLNTDWILHNLDANIPNYKGKHTSYQNNNVNQINTVNRRI